ncbi:MAG: 16S rRNA (cytosine(967)-C(5))-methyltransferase [uncultured Gemmatimonadaceae bacterium]|uniref:16S rRNA (cytosine(967)-C(5))-methyltransferase n=1 Tax=uncultured Gemmatimonadaceae bacterium TaxID=246130 RepID=A0A6J4LGY1_9BACT|nr:MAG: 16S rRNA (cytosine(967)-C(5))-methyltransferase [uncultured Gemmatimonadaceae bacterium]
MPNDRPAGTLGSVTDARVAAADVCADLRGGELLDASFERRTAGLDARDRRWTRELLYEMLRRRSWLDALLSERVRGGLARLDPDLTDLLRLGGYQLLAMGSVPAYAAIAQTVELAKRRHGIGASKLANAVLRRLDRERDALHVATPTDPVEALALEHSHPRWLVARWVGRWGAADTARLLASNNAEAPLIVRPFGVVREQLEAMLEGAGVHVEDAPLVRDSLLIQPGVSLTELGAFRQGLFFVQDPAATLVTEYAAIPPGATVADLCAAPGGKTVELARHAAAVFSADRSLGRLRRVLATLQRLEVRNVFPLVADAREPAVRPVDAVLVDVPCTGTGTFRRHPDARWRLRISDIAVMAALQRAIVRSAARAVRPGGLLVYSTCSLEPEENDAQIESFLAEHPDWRLEPPPEGSVPAAVLDAGRLRVLPQRHGADGSFAARLRRTA